MHTLSFQGNVLRITHGRYFLMFGEQTVWHEKCCAILPTRPYWLKLYFSENEFAYRAGAIESSYCPLLSSKRFHSGDAFVTWGVIPRTVRAVTLGRPKGYSSGFW